VGVSLPAPTHTLLSPLALARSEVDRAAHRRTDDAWLAAAWTDSRTRVVVVTDSKAVIEDGRLELTSPGLAPEGERYFLGVDGSGVAYFAVHAEATGEDARAMTLREAAIILDDRDAGLMVHAVALANWHQAHQHCSRCGAPTDVICAGHVRRCWADGSQHFPRTDPAVIVLVTDERDRCLLGRHPNWPAGRFSTLAGFVEPGETPEQAVVREVAEETGIVVRSCAYAGSQPWPFPSNLMLGYYAVAEGRDPHPDGEEISEARWYSRAELAEAVESGEMVLSPSAAISRRLIEGWYGRELEAPSR
jgi:NAD+ diphosphatase